MELILTIAGIHLIACLSPGPDIFLVLLNSLRDGWRSGFWTTSGILSAVSLHIILGISGISYLLTQGQAINRFIALAGGAWLIYLGIQGLRQWRKPTSSAIDLSQSASIQSSTAPATLWRQGLLVNLLNPKALLYFLSIFSVMLGPGIATSTKVTCGLTMIAAQGIAFTMVALLVDKTAVGLHWKSFQGWLERCISLILTGLGLWIWISVVHSLLD